MQLFVITSVTLLGIVISSTASDITVTQNTNQPFVEMSESIGVCKDLCEQNSATERVHQCQCHMCGVNEAVNCTMGSGKRAVVRFSKWLSTDKAEKRTERHGPMLTTVLCRDIWSGPRHVQTTCDTLNGGITVQTRKYGVRTQCVFTTKHNAQPTQPKSFRGTSKLAPKAGDKEVFDNESSCRVTGQKDVNRKSIGCSTTIWWGAKGGNIGQINNNLANKGESINCLVKYKQTPIFAAALHGHDRVFYHLLAMGARISQMDDNNVTVFHAALEGGNIEIVRTLYELGMGKDSRGKDGVTPILITALFGKIDLFDYLVSKGCDLHAVTEDGSTILHCACSRGKIEMVDHILNMSIPDIDLDRKDHRGWTPLFVAVSNDEVETVEHLIKRGSKVTSKSYTGDTVLHIASHKASLEMVEYLVQFDSIEMSSKNDAGETALMMALKRNDDMLVAPIRDILEEKTRT